MAFTIRSLESNIPKYVNFVVKPNYKTTGGEQCLKLLGCLLKVVCNEKEGSPGAYSWGHRLKIVLCLAEPEID
jgi:hypothetical protein